MARGGACSIGYSPSRMHNSMCIPTKSIVTHGGPRGGDNFQCLLRIISYRMWWVHSECKRALEGSQQETDGCVLTPSEGVQAPWGLVLQWGYPGAVRLAVESKHQSCRCIELLLLGIERSWSGSGIWMPPGHVTGSTCRHRVTCEDANAPQYFQTMCRMKMEMILGSSGGHRWLLVYPGLKALPLVLLLIAVNISW